MSEYSFGKCIICGTNTALKNKKCPKCNDKKGSNGDLGSFFNGIFGK